MDTLQPLVNLLAVLTALSVAAERVTDLLEFAAHSFACGRSLPARMSIKSLFSSIVQSHSGLPGTRVDSG